MAMSGAERQAAFQARQRKALADALAEVEKLQARVIALEQERNHLDGLLGFAVKREEWAELKRQHAEVRASDDADEATTRPPKVVVLRAPPPSRALSARKADHRGTGPLIPPWLLPTPG